MAGVPNDDPARDSGISDVSPSRRLTDKILSAFRTACDQGEIETAEQLFCVLEQMTQRWPVSSERRRDWTLTALAAAHVRLSDLRQSSRVPN